MTSAVASRDPSASHHKGLWRRLLDDSSAISMVEFGLSLPLLVSLGMLGIEIANMASTHMQISQLAISVADNASRLGQTDNGSVAPTVAESDIDAIMFGALRQGEPLDFEEHGRIILSSLERDTATGKQFIRWQRCAGDLTRVSAYGNDSDRNGLTGPVLTGMGKADRRVTAGPGQAVMYAEVFYEYQPIFAVGLADGISFKQEAALLVRDDRNLSGGGGDGLTGTVGSPC